MKAYAKEVGFSVISVSVEHSHTNPFEVRIVKKVICTKNQKVKNQAKDKESNQQANGQDDDCAIVDVIEAGHEDCPFTAMVEKMPSGKWRIYYLNSYHNHLFKKPLTQYTSFINNEFGHGACNPELTNADW